MNFSVVIPTYNREADLKKCLQSILVQNLLPAEILIIDDGDLSPNFLAEYKNQFEKAKISFVYRKKDHKVENRGLSESKNIGLKLSQNDIVFFLDDDLVLEDIFFQSIMRTWDSNWHDPKLIGVGGVILNNRKKSIFERFYNRLFLLDSKYEWDITSTGFQVWNDQISNTTKGFYTHGGVASYRKIDVMKIGSFQTFQGGRTALEDVDFCLRAKISGYYFNINPEAKVKHYQSEVARESNFLMGMKESMNRKNIYTNNLALSPSRRIKFVWANIGWVLRQILVLNFSKGFGMAYGLIYSK